MNEISEMPLGTGEDADSQPLHEFTEKAYLEYAMYVILDRALPHIGDGLKPVQRRITYAMSELGLNATAKHKKSARTVGDVLGKFHPHGDSACYEAMVLMAQPFSYRYPIIDGQGNWGSSDDPKSFAAMRYTEARMARYSEVLLRELSQGTVDWAPNFDGTLEEPRILPARLPNVLLNGATGIAVGMATDIPPHNLREVVDACIHLLDNPGATIENLSEFIQGPDYPTPAEIITSKKDLVTIYEKGTGTLRMRAKHYFENGDIVIIALPHQVSGSKVIEQIAMQMQAKKLPMVSDLRDESDHEDPVRLVIVPKSSRVDKEALLSHLYATTDLEKTFRVNMNMIGLSGRPQVKGLVQILAEWLEYRKKTVIRRLNFRLEKVLERLHLLEGFLIAYLNIDAVIAIIRNEDHPKPILMERFGLTDIQAEAILELKLRHLAKLEEIKIKGEKDALAKERDELEKILGSERRLKTLIRKELKSDAKKYGDSRCSPIVARKEAQALTQVDIMPTEPVTVVLSENGWVRAAKGHDIDGAKLSYKSGDGFLTQANGKSNQLAVFLDSKGRTYAIPAHELPSARGQGEPLSGRLSIEAGAKFVTVLTGAPETMLLIASDRGYGFLARLSDLYTKNKNGKAVLSLPRHSHPLPPIRVDSPETDLLACFTNQGRLLIFPVRDLPQLPRGKGNKIIDIPAKLADSRQEYVSLMAMLPVNHHLILYAGKRVITLTLKSLSEYQRGRGRRGKKLPRVYYRVDRVAVDPVDKGSADEEPPGDDALNLFS